MRLLDRYLGGAVVSGSFIVLLALTALGAFFNLIGEADAIGQGEYGLLDALLYVVLSMPRQAYEMFPVAVLLGAMLGLGNLAAGNELMVMRASGIPVTRLGGSVLSGALMLAVLCVLVGEVLAPPADRYAQHLRARELHQRIGVGSAQGIWVREDDSFVNIRQMSEDGGLRQVYTYRFADGPRLLQARQARRATHEPATGWVLHEVRTSVFEAGQVSTRVRSRSEWQTGLARDLLELFVVDSDTFSTASLWRYIRYLAGNGLDTASYEMAFWTRIVMPFSVLVMAALALPFVFGPMRAAGVGQRMIFGLLLGIGFYVLNQTLANSGRVFGLPPALTVWTPTLLVAAGTLAALRQVR